MMGTPASTTPESSHWVTGGFTGHSTPRRVPFHSSPLVHNSIGSPLAIKQHSTPQRTHLTTPKFNRGGLTPAKQCENRLLSTARSPYYKSYTPLSASPSPAFKTPIRLTKSPHYIKTPVSSILPHSARKFVTPQSQVINPFEDALFSKYHESVLSPSLFNMESTPRSDGKVSRSFRWSIDQLAILHPVDIDEMTCQESQRTRFDKEVEESAQIAINDFFEANNIVMSPWPDASGKPVYLATPKSPKSDKKGSCEEKSCSKMSQDTSCQTMLTFPVGFNVHKVLGEFMTYNGEEDGNQQDSLSNSSLRRKLFNGESSPSVSPSKKSDESLAMQCDEDIPSQIKPLAFPRQDKFSSSPLSFSDGARRFSDDMDGVGSPQLSPINNKVTPLSKGINGLSSPGSSLHGSFMSSPFLSKSKLANRRNQNTMASPELSPICPEGRVRSRLALDMSPICSPRSQTDEVNGSSPEIVLLEQQQQLSIFGCTVEHTPVSKPVISGISPAISTPSTVGTSKASEGSDHVTMATLVTTPGVLNNEDGGSPVKVDEPRPFSGLTFQEPRLLMSDIYMDVTGMEAEFAAHSTQLPSESKLGYRDDRNLSFPISRDCSMNYEETTNPSSMSNLPTSLHSQDTGYQTGSLQLTNQDTGLHTNLICHFSSLPFKSYADSERMDEGIEDDQAQNDILPRPFIRKEKLDTINTSVVSRQLNYQNFPTSKQAFVKEKLPFAKTDFLKTEVEGCALIKDGLTEEEVIAKARLILGQSVSVTSAIPSKTLINTMSSNEGSAPDLTWQPTCSSTPQKITVKSSLIRSNPEDQLPSEMAMKILKRAGEDLAKFS